MKTNSIIFMMIVVFLGILECSNEGPLDPKIDPPPTSNFWVEKKTLPVAIGAHTAVVNGTIYALGGPTKCGQADDVRTIYKYDVEADAWIEIGERPFARVGFRTCAANGKIYVIGGAPNWEDVALDLVQEYDPITGIWTEKSPMKKVRRSFSACTANGKIYVSGGVTACLKFGCCLSFVEEYDPVTDSWAPIPPMSTERHSHSSCVLNGKIYVIGGETPYGVQGYSTTIKSVETYDLETGNWKKVASLPFPLYGLSSSVIDGKIYVVGGANEYTKNFMYDPDTDTWIARAEIMFGRYYHYTEVIDKKIYAITGFDRNDMALTSVAAYTP